MPTRRFPVSNELFRSIPVDLPNKKVAAPAAGIDLPAAVEQDQGDAADSTGITSILH